MRASVAGGRFWFIFQERHIYQGPGQSHTVVQDLCPIGCFDDEFLGETNRSVVAPGLREKAQRNRMRKLKRSSKVSHWLGLGALPTEHYRDGAS